MSEILFSEFTLGIAIAEIGPKEDRIKKLTDSRGEFWKAIPFAQELALAKAYFGFMERDEAVDLFYISGLSHILKWINTLEAASLDGSARERSRPGPLFLEERDQKTINQQIKNLSNFFPNPTAIFSLEHFLTCSVRQLTQAGLTRPLRLAR